MKNVMILSYNGFATTGTANYVSSMSVDSTFEDYLLVSEEEIVQNIEEEGRYSVFQIADWFLSKEPMTPKKLQKLCYYAQAWCYAIKGYRLMDTDFQAWVHGPVSPALYEKFKSFGYNAIKLTKNTPHEILEEDIELLSDVWETYGDKTGNELEMLTHREAPWQEARRGYATGDRCTVVINPDTMKTFYKSIYVG